MGIYIKSSVKRDAERFCDLCIWCCHIVKSEYSCSPVVCRLLVLCMSRWWRDISFCTNTSFIPELAQIKKRYFQIGEMLLKIQLGSRNLSFMDHA